MICITLEDLHARTGALQRPLRMFLEPGRRKLRYRTRPVARPPEHRHLGCRSASAETGEIAASEGACVVATGSRLRDLSALVHGLRRRWRWGPAGDHP